VVHPYSGVRGWRRVTKKTLYIVIFLIAVAGIGYLAGSALVIFDFAQRDPLYPSCGAFTGPCDKELVWDITIILSIISLLVVVALLANARLGKEK
jgi:hypothetical protein